MINLILKCVFLVLAIVYGFSCFGRLFRKQSVSTNAMFLMAIGIVGFIAFQFKWIAF